MIERSTACSQLWTPDSESADRIEPRRIFGDDRPMELEIGSGKGLFLLRESKRRPGVHFLGIERSRKYGLEAARRLEKAGADNVRIAIADARLLLPRFADRSVGAIHVYFPDPWWKRRHRKRRLVSEEFLGQAARLLPPGGRLWIATDVAEYFASIEALFAAHPEFRRLADPEPNAPEHELDYLTHFERKYRLEGRPIWRALFERQGSA